MEKPQKIWNRRFILLFITNLLVLAAFYASIPIIPIYCEQIGITGSKIGIVLTAMSVATILFRPVAGYLLDNFNRYRVYLLFLALFCLSFPAFIAFPHLRGFDCHPLVHGRGLFGMRLRDHDPGQRCAARR